mgnify:CR=1 FL=1
MDQDSTYWVSHLSNLWLRQLTHLQTDISNVLWLVTTGCRNLVWYCWNLWHHLPLVFFNDVIFFNDGSSDTLFWEQNCAFTLLWRTNGKLRRRKKLKLPYFHKHVYIRIWLYASLLFSLQQLHQHFYMTQRAHN